MKTVIFAALCAVVIAGCATPSTMMVNPKDQQIANCSASGWGWIGAPMAMMTHDSCVDSMRSAGWITVDEYKQSQ